MILVATAYDILVIHKVHVSKDDEVDEALKEETAPLLVEANDVDGISHNTYGGTANGSIQHPAETGTPIIGTCMFNFQCGLI